MYIVSPPSPVAMSLTYTKTQFGTIMFSKIVMNASHVLIEYITDKSNTNMFRVIRLFDKLRYVELSWYGGSYGNNYE